MMTPVYTSKMLDDTTCEITCTTTSAVTVCFTREGLLAQRQAILDQQARDNAARKAEIADVDARLALFSVATVPPGQAKKV